MTEISRTALFGRLDTAPRKAIETATNFCKMRGNPYVELVHWVHVLIQDPRGDWAVIRSAFAVDDARLAGDVVAALDALPRGATAISDFAPQIEEAIEKGWLYASLQFGAGRVRSGHLLYGMLRTPTLRNALFEISGEWRKIAVDRLGDEFDALVSGSTERTEAADLPLSEPGSAPGDRRAAAAAAE
jgi:type VI secretion system protein VasG